MTTYVQDWIDRTRYHEFSAAAVGACVLNIVFVGAFDWAARQAIQGQVIPGAEFWTEAALKAQPNCPPIRFIYNFERPVTW